MIVFLRIDEFKKAHNYEEVRKEICDQMDYFYKHIEDCNVYLRVVFTSFLPEDVRENTEGEPFLSFFFLTWSPSRGWDQCFNNKTQKSKNHFFRSSDSSSS